jgi:hypothetical protein
MPEVELILQSNVPDYTKQLLDALQANSKFFDSFAKEAKQNGELWEGMIEGMREELKSLGISEEQFLAKFKASGLTQVGILEKLEQELKQYQEAKRKATTTGDIDSFNKKISQTQKEISKLNSQGANTESGFNKVKGALLRFTGGMAAGYAVIRGFNALMKQADSLGDAFEQGMQGAKSGLKSFLNTIASGEWGSFFSNFAKAERAGEDFAKVMDELEDKRTALAFKEDAVATRYVKNMGIIRDATKSIGEVTKAVDEIMADQDNLLKERSDNATKDFEASKKRIAAERNITEQQLMDYVTQNAKGLRIYESASEEYIAMQKKIEEENPFSPNQNQDFIMQLRKSQLKRFEAQRPYLKEAHEIWLKLNNIGPDDKQELVTKNKEIEGVQQAYFANKNKAERRANILAAREAKNALKDDKKDNSGLLKQQEDFIKLKEELQKKTTDTEIEGLTGKAKIDAQEKANLAEVDDLKKQLEKLGKVTQEQGDQLNILRAGIRKKAQKDRLDFDREELSKQKEQSNSARELMLKQADEEINILADTDEEKLQMQIDTYSKMLANINELGDFEAAMFADNLRGLIRVAKKELEKTKPEKGFSIWKLLGIDTNSDKGKEQMEGVKMAIGEITNSIGQMMDAEIALAEQRAQIVDDRLNELESQLDDEKQLQEEGLANNVESVQKEITETKKQRDKAAAEEKKAKQAQLILDSAVQLSSMITASANIFKATSSILPPLGQILAIGAIGLMLTAFTTSKVKAANAIKLEEGAYLDNYKVVKGKRHSQGGEPLNRHVEIEHGEGLGVFNRSATSYYGDRLPEWVADINAKDMPKYNIQSGNINTYQMKVDKMERELEKVNKGLDLMNENLLSQMFHVGSDRIEKRRNHTRIIHVNR